MVPAGGGNAESQTVACGSSFREAAISRLGLGRPFPPLGIWHSALGIYIPRMTITADLAAKGTISHVQDATTGQMNVVFNPNGTNYLVQASAADAAAIPADRLLKGVIRVRARKVYTVPSGGAFVQPVFGSPRIIQGRVMSLDERSLVVKAGAVFVVELPTGQDTIDLHTGAIAAGSLVNVVALPGATFERVG